MLSMQFEGTMKMLEAVRDLTSFSQKLSSRSETLCSNGTLLDHRFTTRLRLFTKSAHFEKSQRCAPFIGLDDLISGKGHCS